MMKEYYLLAISGLFALPGCFLQSKIADDMQAHQTQIDRIIAEYERNNGVVLLREYAREKIEKLSLPPDTVIVEMLADAIEQSEQIVHTDTHTITVTPVVQPDGRRTIKVQAVTRPQTVTAVNLPYNQSKRQGRYVDAQNAQKIGTGAGNSSGVGSALENLYLLFGIISAIFTALIFHLKKRKK
jgi:hypothetical protein